MVWIGVVVFVIIYACRKGYTDQHKQAEWFDMEDVIYFCRLPLFFIAGFVLIAHLLYVCLLPSSLGYEIEESLSVYALQDSISYVSCSNADGDPRVAYLIESEDGKSIKTTSSDKTFFVESSEVQPRVDIYKVHIVENWQYLFLNNSLLNLFAEKKYIFTIPPGSIAVDYQVDLE